MTKRSARCRWFIGCIPAAVLAVFLHGPAGAASLRIKPYMFLESVTLQAGLRYPYLVTSRTQSPASYYYPLSLPVGSRITGLRYRHSGGPGADTEVSVDWVKASATPALTEIFRATSQADTSGVLGVPVPVTGVRNTDADNIVKRGGRYFLSIIAGNSGSAVWEVVVEYQ